MKPDSSAEPAWQALYDIAASQTFEFRATHPLPSSLPDPPANWRTPYIEMARENELVWTTLEQLTAAVRIFLNPVLAGDGGLWGPSAWAWEPSSSPAIAP